MRLGRACWSVDVVYNWSQLYLETLQSNENYIVFLWVGGSVLVRM